MKNFMNKLRQILQNMSQKEVVISENFSAVAPAATFAVKQILGLTATFYGGIYQNSAGNEVEVDEVTLTFADNMRTYVEYDPNTNTIIRNTISFSAGNIKIAVVDTEDGVIKDIFDRRAVAFYATGTPPNLTYTLPTSSTTTLGGVKVDGTSITIDNNGVISSSGGGGGGGGSLVVKENENTLNNNVSTINFAGFNSSLKSSGTTVTIDNFCNSDNLISYYIPVQAISSAHTLGAWTGSTTAVNMLSNWTISDDWSQSSRRSISTTAVALNTASLTSNTYLVRSIYKRAIYKAKIGYHTEFTASNIPASTVDNSSMLLGLNSTNKTTFFTKDFETTSDSICGVGWRSTDTNLQIVYTSAVTSETTFIDLGTNFPIPDLSKGNACFYDVVFDSNRSETDISISVKRLDVSHEVSHTVSVLKVHYMHPKFTLITHDAVIKKMQLGSMFTYMS